MVGNKTSIPREVGKDLVAQLFHAFHASTYLVLLNVLSESGTRIAIVPFPEPVVG